MSGNLRNNRKYRRIMCTFTLFPLSARWYGHIVLILVGWQTERIAFILFNIAVDSRQRSIPYYYFSQLIRAQEDKPRDATLSCTKERRVVVGSVVVDCGCCILVERRKENVT